jgi:hypothetical protein
MYFIEPYQLSVPVVFSRCLSMSFPFVQTVQTA